MTSSPFEQSVAPSSGPSESPPTTTVDSSLERDDCPAGVGVEEQVVALAEPEASAWSIDDVVPTDWSEFADSLASWKQSDLVSDVPLTWLTAPGADPITGVSNDLDEIRPTYDRHLRVTAIICSQTCDLGGTPPGDAHPFILLAPLVPSSSIPSRGMQKLAAEGKVGYLVRTLPPPAPEVCSTPDLPSGLASPPAKKAKEAWFADLRLLFPASKALLLDREPVPGFADENERLAFAETIALKFRRVALNETLSEALPRTLRQFVKDNGHTKQAFAQVEQVRLLVLGGSRLYPTRATLFVLTNGTQLNEDSQEIWGRFQKTASDLLAAAEIALGPMVHVDVNDLSAVRYRDSVPVRCDLLGSINWF